MYQDSPLLPATPATPATSKCPSARFLSNTLFIGALIVAALSSGTNSTASAEDYYWSFKVQTSNISGASTNANVKVWLIGSKGKMGETRIDSSGPDFDQGQTGTYSVRTNVDIGKPQKWGIMHDDTGRGAGWHLKSVEISYLGTKGTKALWTQHFDVNKWLSVDKDGYKGNRWQSRYYEDEFTPPEIAVHLQPPGGDWRDYPTDRYQRISFVTGPQTYTLEAEKAKQKTASLSRNTSKSKEHVHSFTAELHASYTHGFDSLSSATFGASFSDTTAQKVQQQINLNKQIATAETRTMKEKREVPIKDHEVVIVFYEIVEVRSLTPGHLILGEERLEFNERTFYGQPHFEKHVVGSQALADRIREIEQDERYRGLLSKQLAERYKIVAPPRTADSSQLATRIDSSKKELTDLRDKLLAARARIASLEKTIADLQTLAEVDSQLVEEQNAHRDALSSELLARVTQLEVRLQACCGSNSRKEPSNNGNSNSNTGNSNTGNSNTGNSNTGNSNTGNSNTGNSNTGTLFGDFSIRSFADDDDQTGTITGTMSIQRDGRYTRSVQGLPTTRGKLTFDGESFVSSDGTVTLRGTFYELEGDVGYGIELADETYEQWEKSPNPGAAPQDIPRTLVGEFKIRGFENDADQLGVIVGTITVRRDGSLTRSMHDGPMEQGKLSVRGDVLTLHIGEEQVRAEYFEIEGGFGVDLSSGYQQWENGELDSSQLGMLVGDFSVRAFADNKDLEGNVIGKIKIDPDGRYTMSLGDGQTKRGRLAVRGESLTLDDGNQQLRADFYPIEGGFGIEFAVGNYQQWEVAADQLAPLPQSLVGDFIIRSFRGEQDEEGFIAGTMKISADGSFTREVTGQAPQEGRLTVRGEVLTMTMGGTQSQAIHYEIQGGFGVELGQQTYEQWERERGTGDGPTIQIPDSLVGSFQIRLFESDEDQRGYLAGTMKIERDGSYRRAVRDQEPTTGRLTVRGDSLTLTEGSQQRRAVFYELEDGFGVEDIGVGYEQWEQPDIDSGGPGGIPSTLVGEYRVRRFESAEDERGYIAGMITILPTGSFTKSLRNEPVTQGKLTLSGETLSIHGPNVEQAEFYALEELGYGVELASGYEQWERGEESLDDNTSIPQALVGDFRIRRFADEDDEIGYITGTMRIGRDGSYTRELQGLRPLRGTLQVFGESLTLDHGPVKVRSEFYTGSDFVQIARLDDGEEVWERHDDARRETVIVGEFNIRSFKPSDTAGFIAGTMRIADDGSYTRTYNGQQFQGRLTTNGELLTLTEKDRHVRTRFTTNQQPNGTAYDIENAGAGHEVWEGVTQPGGEQVPDTIVGVYSIRKFAGADDQVGFVAGTMTIAKDGSYTRVYDDRRFNGQLTVEGGILSLMEGNRTVRTEFNFFDEGPDDSGLEIKNAGSGFEEWTREASPFGAVAPQ